MTAKRTLDAVLAHATGYELRVAGSANRRRPLAGPGPGDRLVTAPTFILCTVRSGSTLLRVLLNSHSRIHAPQELHLRYIAVKLRKKWGKRAMHEVGLDPRALEYLLWDRILHRELARSGKQTIVCKTPNDVFMADRIVEAWPDARFIFLLRHPAATLRSRRERRRNVDAATNIEVIRQYCEALESARRRYPGHTVRYEELTADAAGVMQGVCTFLSVPWEPGMLDYGRCHHGRYRAGLGDWGPKIRSGKVQPAASLPAAEDTPLELRDIATAWGYTRGDALLEDSPPDDARRS